MKNETDDCKRCAALRAEVARLLVRESELEAKLRNARQASAPELSRRAHR